MRYLLSLFLGSGILILSACSNTHPESENDNAAFEGAPAEIITTAEYSLNVFDFEGLSPILDAENDTTYVINFWATWCKPCIKELPYFEKVHREYSGKPVKVILVSLDMREQAESKLIPFILSNDISAEVMLLDDPDANSWISKVDETWSGAIPATLFYNADERLFLEKEFEYEELIEIIQSII
jgi:thiol-disulfide isomerase/thioredoxin